MAEAEKIIDYALDGEEKELCANVVVFGPGWLRQNKQWKAEAIERFLTRAEVQREINALSKHYEDRQGIQERTQFFAQLKINGMVPAAVAVLAKSLAGVRKNEDGTLIPPPSRQQFEAAVEILDRANIQGQKYGGNDAVPAIDARSVQIAIGGSMSDVSKIGAEGRERVRGILSMALNRVKAKAKADDVADSRKARVEKALGPVTTEDDDQWEENGKAPEDPPR
jgi:hypothetical protein